MSQYCKIKLWFFKVFVIEEINDNILKWAAPDGSGWLTALWKLQSQSVIHVPLDIIQSEWGKVCVVTSFCFFCFLRLTSLVGLPAVHHPAVPVVRGANGPKVGEGHGSVVVCGRGGGQAAGVGGVRGLTGRGGVVCQSERRWRQQTRFRSRRKPPA